jgi:DNA-binding NarL/FixJ family response regulator
MHMAVTIPAISEASVKIQFTDRQEQITELILRGMPNNVIAETLGLAERTVKSHLGSLYLRLGIQRRNKRIALAVAMLASERGIADIRVPLTARQREIVAGVCDSKSNREIGLTLGTTEQVIKNYLRVILDKTGSNNRLELALYAIRSDIRHSLATPECDEAERAADKIRQRDIRHSQEAVAV